MNQQSNSSASIYLERGASGHSTCRLVVHATDSKSRSLDEFAGRVFDSEDAAKRTIASHLGVDPSACHILAVKDGVVSVWQVSETISFEEIAATNKALKQQGDKLTSG